MDLNINVAEMEAKRKKELEEEEIERHLLSEQFDIAIYGLVINKFPGLSIRETGIVRWKFHDDVGEKVERMSPLLRKAKEYYNELLALSSADLFALEREQRESKGAQGNKPTVSDVVNRGWFFEQLDAQADLEHWSRAEYWTPDEAAAVSFGKNPNVVNANTLKSYLGKASFADEYYLRRDLVDRAVATGHLPEEIPPADFIDWSQSKGLDSPEDLIEHLDALSATPTRFWDGFDVDSPTYPEELDIAFQAWRAISKHCDPNRTPKQQIRSWVSSNYPGVKTEALERISVMCNWSKQGGRKKKD